MSEPTLAVPALILLNGPPRCGKDTLAHLLELQYGMAHHKVTKRFKERVHALYGMAGTPHDAFDDVKDLPHAAFDGYTPRQIYIEIWEKYLKPMHGEDYIINQCINEIMVSSNAFTVVSDLGFDRELQKFVDHFNNIIVVKIERPGVSYGDDIRSYVDLNNIRCDNKRIEEFTVINDEKPRAMFWRCDSVIRNILDKWSQPNET